MQFSFHPEKRNFTMHLPRNTFSVGSAKCAVGDVSMLHCASNICSIDFSEIISEAEHNGLS